MDPATGQLGIIGWLLNRRTTPIQSLLFGFIALILAGAVLLTLPLSATDNQSTSFLDAVFTATSAVSTTGLVVVDTGTHFNLFGQTVILVLFQIGGLGYMMFIALASLGVGSSFTIRGRMVLTESMARPTNVELKRFVKAVFLVTFGVELLAALLLLLCFLDHYPLANAVYSSIFHSVSAFCTAGFSSYADSFTPYAFSWQVNVIIAITTFLGGIGFFVVYDLAIFARKALRKEHPLKLSDHSKLALVLTAFLMIGGSVALFFTEFPKESSLSWSDRILTASFQAFSASTTTGFNTIDIGSMTSIGLIYLVLLMLIGASPGSTGGGIKTTTFGIILLFIRSVFTNPGNVHVFRRAIPPSTVYKALGIGILAAFYLAVISLILSESEKTSFLSVLFESTSVLGTVGLSMGLTGSLSTVGKILITITMLIGRVGPLAIGFSLIGSTLPPRHRYPSGDVLVG